MRVYYKEGVVLGFFLFNKTLKKKYSQHPGGGALLWNEILKVDLYVFKKHCYLNLRVEIDQSLLTRSTNCMFSLRLLAADTPATAAKSNRIVQWLFIIKLQTETKWIARYNYSLYRQSVINFIIFNIKGILINGYLKKKSFRQFGVSDK